MWGNSRRPPNRTRSTRPPTWWRSRRRGESAGRKASTRRCKQTTWTPSSPPTGSPAWPNDLVNGDHFLGASSGPAAIAGYPIINVPAGDAFGLPVGISFMGTAWSEPTLIKLSSGFEAVSKARKTPKFLPTLPTDTGGVSPKPRTLGSPMAHSSGPAHSSNPVTGRI